MDEIDNYLKGYSQTLFSSLVNLDSRNLKLASDSIIKTIKKNKTIYVCGNGGSASIANHYICDFLKFFRDRTSFKPKIISMSNNIETITAIANDISYDEIFRYQAQSLCKRNDLIIIISSSGNSKNIKKLIQFTKKNKIKTIGFSGFDGGYLKKNSNISIHINAKNYGISEDAHHVLMHVLLQFIIFKFEKKKNSIFSL